MDTEKPGKLDNRPLNVRADIPDDRDFYYQPSLRPLARAIPVPEKLRVLNQGQEGACTGFALAAVINLLRTRQGGDKPVSARMLYEMARKFDEWPGEDYAGSSCRGAIRGWRHMGVCSETEWPYRVNSAGQLTVERAKQARHTTIGAYYRLRHDVVDFHSALNEAGVVFCSADVHSGWSAASVSSGKIPMRAGATGGHAFALVGYDEDGFYVQNSWGKEWGKNGIALWRYEDWKENIKDAWVVQLARPTPQIFPGVAKARTARGVAEAPKPSRNEIMGHFVHLDDGRFHDSGRYFSNMQDVRNTARLVAASDKYDHVLFYAHGGLNSPDDSARRIAALRDTFKANRIYPYHFMYDTGLGEELKDVILGRGASDRTAGISDWSDRLLEWAVRRGGRALWGEMKAGAALPFKGAGDGARVVDAFVEEIEKSGKAKHIHLVGHSNGSILQGALLTAMRRRQPERRVRSCSLLAPAASVSVFEDAYRPALKDKTVEQMVVYNLSDKLEREDTVFAIYRKSLLYLVSRAFEGDEAEPLLGMERYSKDIDTGGLALTFTYSTGRAGRGQRTLSTSHGGFDNDPLTMNDVLKTVLGREPGTPFTKETLDY